MSEHKDPRLRKIKDKIANMPKGKSPLPGTEEFKELVRKGLIIIN